MRKLTAFVVSAALITGCVQDVASPTEADVDSRLAISDAVHSGGTDGFFFLPPMVPAPSTTGVFDADLVALNPRVDICDLTADFDCGGATPALQTFTTNSNPAIAVSGIDEQFHVNWDTRGPAFDAGHTYRIHVSAGVAGARRELGFADVLLTSSPGQAKNVATDDVIILNDGRTLPVKFRIETQIAGAITLALDPSIVGIASSSDALATVLDLHGSPMIGSVVGWSVAGVPATVAPTSSSTGIDGGASTTVTAGTTAGLVTVTAETAGLSASGELIITAPSEMIVSVRIREAVVTFPLTASGNVSPSRVLQGPNTGLRNPYGVVTDQAGQLLVANNVGNSINVYAAGASGDAPPIAVIQGSNTGLNSPTGIALDDAGNIYVGSDLDASVTVFAAGAYGNVAPIRKVRGSSTLLSGPGGLAIDAQGRLYVANTCCLPDISGTRVTVYAPGATGNVAPIAVIGGPNNPLGQPYGLAIAATGELYVASLQGDAILIFAAGANGDVAPVAAIAGPATTLDQPQGIDLLSDGTLLVVNYHTKSILSFAPGSVGNVAPTSIIGGALTLLTPDPGFVTH